MRTTLLIVAFCFVVPASASLLIWYDQARQTTDIVLLNVSCDPTRELWSAINQKFCLEYGKAHGVRVSVRQSHGGSSSQAHAIIDGLPADVVTLALWSDTDLLRQAGLLHDDWGNRFVHQSCPYFSTIVFVVRKGNPKKISDWPDLAREGLEVVTPNPMTSGNGKLSFLACWGAVRQRGGTDAEARDFVTRVYRNVKVLDAGARGAAMTFAQNGRGDVHLAWENEARLEVREYGDQLEIIYPPISIRADLPVAVVDKVVDEKGTRAVAEAYLRSLDSPEYQALMAGHWFRPRDPDVLAQFADVFPNIKLFDITAIAPSWNAAQERFFTTGGVFEQVFLR